MTVDPTADRANRERLRDLALDAARAGARLVGSSDQVTPVATKSTRTDIVTATDLAAEGAIRDVLRHRSPGSRLLAEEGGHQVLGEGPDDEVEWIVDPLDGTVNFAYGLPVTSVSVAAAIAGRAVAGAVVDVRHGEEFDAVLGAGARCDGVPIAVSSCAELELALVATGFAYDRDRRLRHGETIAHLLGRVRDIRAFGSAALHLCWVGAGRVDAYVERDIKPWDHAAGALVAAEGGAIVELPCIENDGTALAAPPALHRALRHAITRPAS